MSKIKRRHFLELSGSFLATLGLSQLEFQRQSLRYAQGLAQTTSRKLALLVGINEYPVSSAHAPLLGCVTDVQLQQELLVNRFGFNPADVHTLTDQQATRSGILTAFEELVIKPSKPGDVIVFHYSGHGSQIADPDQDHADGKNSTFVPIDSALPEGFPKQGGTVQDITGHTLFLLMKAVQTDNLTVVLDSCHSGGGTRGNLRVRSRDGGAQLDPSPEELAYQQQWLSRLNLSPEEFIAQRRAGVARGAVVAGAGRDQLAADADFDNFAAGMFSYMLTQYLWQQTADESIQRVFPNLSRTTSQESTSRQQPIFEVKPNSDRATKPIYLINQAKPPADGAITQALAGDRLELWLGGIDAQSIAAFGPGSQFNVLDANYQTVGDIELESRQGLIGQGKKVGTGAIAPGNLLQEKIRGIPGENKLIVGLGETLGDEGDAAQQALAAIPYVKAVPLLQGEVHCIFGRFTDKAQSATNLPPVNSLGLFSPGNDVIPDSFASADESVSSAVNRLQSKLKSLLAVRMVKLLLNTESSRLNITATMSPEASESQLIAQVFPTRGIIKSTGKSPTTAPLNNSRQLPVGTPVQFQIQNQETYALYLNLLVIDPAGEMSVVFPNNWTASEESTQLAPEQTIRIPDPNGDRFQLVVQEPKGTVEVLILASRSPLRQSLKALQGIAQREGQTRGPVPLSDPIDIINDLLDDVSQGTRGGSRPRGLGVVAREVDTSQLAAMSITFEVI